MRITFHGAAGSVTGSRHLLEANGQRVLLDCGLFQGRREESDRRNREFGFDPRSIDAVVLSHAHIDHSGALPALVKAGFEGDIHMTLASADLDVHMLRDSAFLQEKDAEYATRRNARRKLPPREPLYRVEDADRAVEHFEGHNYHRWFQVAPGIRARFLDAGHILGSAIVELEVTENGERRSVVFSGDLGRKCLPIIRDPEQLETPDVLILESTYGDREHAPIEQAAEQLAAVVHKVCERRAKLIIPAFAVGRTQEIVHELVQLWQAKRIPHLPIFVDSPLAVNVTEVFDRHPECFDAETRARLRAAGDPFGLRVLTYVRSKEESMALNEREGPFVVISASGMAEGGRVLHHLRNSIEDPRNLILFVGFQAEHTLGRRLVRGDRTVNIFGEPYEVRAEIVVMNEFSAHADRNELLSWVQANRGRPRDLFLVHGEPKQSAAFAARLAEEGFTGVHVPALHESVALGGAHPRS